jgi:hypothetical protein
MSIQPYAPYANVSFRIVQLPAQNGLPARLAFVSVPVVIDPAAIAAVQQPQSQPQPQPQSQPQQQAVQSSVDASAFALVKRSSAQVGVDPAAVRSFKLYLI